jgi:flagellar biogenesis protein FliO
MGSRLAVVLGLFAALLLIQRWLGGPRSSTLPTDVIQVYGRAPLTAKQQLLLVRVGERLLILLESGQGISRLAEITDPAEVSRLSERFRQEPAPGRTALAREFLSQIGASGSHPRG